MKTKLQRIALALFFGMGATTLAAAAEPSSGRVASLAEIRELFQLATNGQPRSHFVADIEVREIHWTAEQIAKEANSIEEFMAEADAKASGQPPVRRPAAISEVQSNAIVRAHSGVKLLHVQEWYSGKHYRIDQTDESEALPGRVKFVPGHYQWTYVNLRDPEFSPYTSYEVNNPLRSANFTRQTNMVWGTRNLWEAKGLEREVGGPLLVALVDWHSMAAKGRGMGDSVKSLILDAAKAESLHGRTDKRWHLTAAEETLNGMPVTHFMLTGKNLGTEPGPLPPDFSPVEISYWIAHQGKQVVCLQATLTNLTQHSYYESRREDFAENGYPRVWKTTFFEEGVLKRGMTITFNKVEPEAKFDEAEVFLPEYLHYYMVSDVTSGTGVPARDVFKE